MISVARVAVLIAWCDTVLVAGHAGRGVDAGSRSFLSKVHLSIQSSVSFRPILLPV